ncbi:MAG TPA: hypothetical protein ENO23_00345 [Alphaproteobacteria bacterium]|nr:hypothetical protein [Alphaproteobacteria bacterium]
MIHTLPFTPSEFFEVFARYNALIWPGQWIAAVLGVVVVGAVFVGSSVASRLAATVLAAFWFLMGAVYHFVFFSSINPAATAFGALFLVQSGLLLRYGVVHPTVRFGLLLAAGVVAVTLALRPAGSSH